VPGITVDAERWRQRAAKARAEAEQMRHPDARQAMLRVAEACDRVARSAEAKAADEAARSK